MFEGKHIQVGAGRYIQCHGALKRAGEEMVFFGKKAYLLYGDDLVKGKTSQVLEESLRESGITFQSEIFEGPSTEKSFGEVAARVRESGAEIVAGIGGGRIIDIAKAAGDMVDAQYLYHTHIRSHMCGLRCSVCGIRRGWQCGPQRFPES